jgi:hypothetical protein
MSSLLNSIEDLKCAKEVTSNPSPISKTDLALFLDEDMKLIDQEDIWTEFKKD